MAFSWVSRKDAKEQKDFFAPLLTLHLSVKFIFNYD